jgi:hypothetical protein
MNGVSLAFFETTMDDDGIDVRDHTSTSEFVAKWSLWYRRLVRINGPRDEEETVEQLLLSDA